MFKDREQILLALSQTGRRLVIANADDHGLLVCGGAALNLAGFLARPTRDVDVVGLVKGEKGNSVVNQVLPDEVRGAAEMVAMELNLPDDWLNDAALEVHRMGLPEGILERASKRTFGPCLTVYLISRQDQVALKLYAAIDPQKGQRHHKDLVEMVPTKSEMEFAVGWLLNRTTSVQFNNAVQGLAESLGFPNLKVLQTAVSKTQSISEAISSEKGRKSSGRKRPLK